MKRGEVWWALLDEKRPVVILAAEGEELRGMQIVAPTDTDLADAAVEVRLGGEEGLADVGVVRVALPRAGLIPCTWLVTVTREDLVERAGRLSSAKLRELTEVLRLAQIE